MLRTDMWRGWGRFRGYRPWSMAVIGCLAVMLATVTGAVAGTIDLDFGLPLFDLDEIRLEHDKKPDFNYRLLDKYLQENAARPLVHLHAISSWYGLIRLSDAPRSKELLQRLRQALAERRTAGDDRQRLIDRLYFEGLSVVTGPASDPANVADRAFEEVMIETERQLASDPHYLLAKGIVLSQLRSRPNGYFSPFKPLEDLKKAGNLAPRDAHFHFVLGQAFRALGAREVNLFNALVAYEKAGRLAPRNPKVHSALLGIYMGLHESYRGQGRKEPFWLEEAVYKKILTMSPNNPHALNNLGFLYAEYGVNRPQAVELCQRAVDMMPRHAGFRDSLGWAAFKNGDHAKAEAELKKAISINPRLFDPYYHLGTVYYVNKRFDEAARAFDQALQIDPNSAEALNNYAYMLAEQNREIGKAKELAKRALALDPNNASYIDTMGWIEYRRGDLKAARTLLEKAAALMPDVAEIQAHLGKVYQEQYLFDRALSMFRKAFSNDPDQADLREEVFLTLNLQALHHNIATYHRLFGDKASIDHLVGMLLQLSRLYQDVGQFRKAIRYTRLCEELRSGKRGLAKALLPSYQLPAARPAAGADVASAPAVAPAAEGGDEGGFEYPTVAEVPVAVHAGPVLFRAVAGVIQAFPGFETLGVTLLLPRLSWRGRGLILGVQSPQLVGRDGVGVVRFALSQLAIVPDLPLPALAGGEAESWTGFGFRLGRRRWWVLQDGDRIWFFRDELPALADVRRLRSTFPYDANGLAGLLIDWTRVVADVPQVLRGFVPANLQGITRMVSTWSLDDEGTVHESSHFVIGSRLDQERLGRLQRELQAVQARLDRYGIGSEFNVEAFGSVCRLSGKYLGCEALVSSAWRRVGIAAFWWRDRLHGWICFLRRAFGHRAFSKTGGLCPDGGETSLEAGTGMLRCSRHPQWLAFPIAITAEDRCTLARLRLQGIMRGVKQRLGPDRGAACDRLLESAKTEYNVAPCPAGGTWTVDSECNVSCSVHRSPAH